jgi:hypothetical protein
VNLAIGVESRSSEALIMTGCDEGEKLKPYREGRGGELYLYGTGGYRKGTASKAVTRRGGVGVAKFVPIQVSLLPSRVGAMYVNYRC